MANCECHNKRGKLILLLKRYFAEIYMHMWTTVQWRIIRRSQSDRWGKKHIHVTAPENGRIAPNHKI